MVRRCRPERMVELGSGFTTLAAAEGGCQAEIGVASGMAAALIAQVMDSPPHVVENAAESALEHHLGAIATAEVRGCRWRWCALMLGLSKMGGQELEACTCDADKTQEERSQTAWRCSQSNKLQQCRPKQKESNVQD